MRFEVSSELVLGRGEIKELVAKKASVATSANVTL